MARVVTQIVTPDAVFAAVDDHMGGPMIWGQSDCTASACAVFAALHGVDPLQPLRGSYDSPITAARMIRRAGGMLALGQRLARGAGLVRCGEVPGAIGILRNDGRLVAAICLMPGKWSAKTADGFAILGGMVAAWRRQ